MEQIQSSTYIRFVALLFESYSEQRPAIDPKQLFTIATWTPYLFLKTSLTISLVCYGTGCSGGRSIQPNFNVALGFSFICFDAILSLTLGLGVGTSLVVSAVRCVLQLSVMSLILDKVFAANNFWGVVGIALLLNVLGAFEAVYNKSKRRFANMFPLILLSFIVATIPISLAGSAVMRRHPVWKPEKYVPVLGMILGNAVTAIGVGVSSILKEFTENRDKIETYLGMGATRFEACKPIAREALKLALLPTINQMSVIGLISIPGLMTGAIIGGSSVEQAAKLQMILMFMISASSALSVLAAMIFTFSVVFDPQHRIRGDRIYSSESVLSGGIRSVGKIGVLGWKSIKKFGRKNRRP